jgi:hypothetical protein
VGLSLGKIDRVQMEVFISISIEKKLSKSYLYPLKFSLLILYPYLLKISDNEQITIDNG